MAQCLPVAVMMEQSVFGERETHIQIRRNIVLRIVSQRVQFGMPSNTCTNNSPCEKRLSPAHPRNQFVHASAGFSILLILKIPSSLGKDHWYGL